MENFSELVKIRRSMRKFTEEELMQDEVVALLRAALMSPSFQGNPCLGVCTGGRQATFGTVGTLQGQGSRTVAGAPLAVVVLADPQVSDVWIEDASVAPTMLLLQAEDLGLGACWVQVRNRSMADGKPAEEMVRAMLHIPEHLRVLSIVAIGHKGMERKPFNEDRLLWEKVHFNTFDTPQE